ncbi:MAG: rhomboid family intramembrane serine protease [Myxococcales bacterium]
MSDAESFEVVFESHDQVETEIAADLLEKNGLTPRMLGSRNAALLGAANFAFLLKVEVPTDQVERAQDLLGAFMQEQQEAPEIAEEEWKAGSPEDDGAASTPAEPAPPAETAATPGADASPEKPSESDLVNPPPASSRSPVLAPIAGLLALMVTLYALSGRTTVEVEELGGVRGWPAPGELYRLVTASFLHFDLGHLLSNAEGLVVYGWAAIALFGLGRTAFAFMTFALAGGLACTLLVGEHSLAAGSSGCVFGLTAMVLAGKFRQARAEKVAGWRGRIKVLGWAAFVVPSALFFSYVIHFAGLLSGAVLGATLAMAPANEEQPALVRRGKWFAGLAVALFLLPWGQRIAAGFYSPCRTGNVGRCAAACDRGDFAACHQVGLKRLEQEAVTPSERHVRALEEGL